MVGTNERVNERTAREERNEEAFVEVGKIGYSRGGQVIAMPCLPRNRVDL